ncbi:MAG: DUF5676 family membrane protein [Patescibacteria group bacterium]
MKVNKMMYANAFAVTVSFVWLICSFGVAFLPDLSLTMSKWFMHGLDMTSLGLWKVTIDGFILGGLVLVGFGWVTGYVFGGSMEYFGKK